MREAVQKARSEQVAGAGGVDDAPDRLGGNDVGLIARDDHGAFFRARQGGDLAMPAHHLQGRVEIINLVERGDFLFVGEQDIDLVFDQIEEFVAPTLDAKRIRQAERDLAACRKIGRASGRESG